MKQKHAAIRVSQTCNIKILVYQVLYQVYRCSEVVMLGSTYVVHGGHTCYYPYFFSLSGSCGFVLLLFLRDYCGPIETTKRRVYSSC